MFKKILFLPVLLVLNACNGSSSSDKETPLANNIDISENQYFRVMSPTKCTQIEKNRFLYQVMHDSYLWADETVELDYKSNEYNSSEKLLTALKNSHDKFSFIVDAKVAQSFFEEGKNDNFGMGLALIRLSETQLGLVVRFVYPNSPADKQGVKRGDIIKLVNNKAIREEELDELNDILTNEKSVEFAFLNREDGTVTNKNITKNSYKIDTILYSTLFTNQSGSKKVGYFVFQDFIGDANEQIDKVFNAFKANGVNELILDLRYNGGGATSIANHLASLIGGSNVSENIFNKVILNDYYSRYNEISRFEEQQNNALNLNRVFVITTDSTCSSSELVINSLRASANNVEVIQIGSTTCGKPYGFFGSGTFCDKALYAINFESKNGDDVGGYVDGLTPTCEADDDILKPFGDVEEYSLAEALNYIETNRCSAPKNEKTTIEKMRPKNGLELPKDGFKRIMSAY